MTNAKAAEAMEPHKTARRPARPCSMSDACFPSSPLPTFKTSSEAAQNRHGNYRGGDRSGKSKSSFEPGVYVGRSEYQGNDDSYDYPADGKFLAHIRSDVG